VVGAPQHFEDNIFIDIINNSSDGGGGYFCTNSFVDTYLRYQAKSNTLDPIASTRSRRLK
jgi:hypothetical protein